MKKILILMLMLLCIYSPVDCFIRFAAKKGNEKIFKNAEKLYTREYDFIDILFHPWDRFCEKYPKSGKIIGTSVFACAFSPELIILVPALAQISVSAAHSKVSELLKDPLAEAIIKKEKSIREQEESITKQEKKIARLASWTDSNDSNS